MRYLAILILLSFTASARAADFHEGDLLAVQNLPYCTTLTDAELVADYSRKHGSGFDEYQKLPNCNSGTGYVTLGKQLDSFPDNKTTGGTRYIVEVTGGNHGTLYGLFSEPVLPVGATGI